MNNPNNFHTGAPPQRPSMAPGGQMMGGGGQMTNMIMRNINPNQGNPNMGMNNPIMNNIHPHHGGPPNPGHFQTNNMNQPNMMGPGMPQHQHPPEPPKPQKIKVELSNKERGFYSNMISKMETDANNRIDGKQAVTFFKTSGVDINILKSIYRTCARTSVESLGRDEFYVALRLIAYAQNGVPPTEDSIRQNIEVPFPQFKMQNNSNKNIGGMGGPGMGGMPPQQPQFAPNIADTLPDLNNMNIAALNQNPEGSMFPGMDERLKQREVEKAQEKMSKSQDSPWFLRPEDVQKYNNFFKHFNKSGSGVLNIEETKEAFMQTQLDEDTLEKVWGLVDTEEVGEFNNKMF